MAWRCRRNAWRSATLEYLVSWTWTWKCHLNSFEYFSIFHFSNIGCDDYDYLRSCPCFDCIDFSPARCRKREFNAALKVHWINLVFSSARSKKSQTVLGHHNHRMHLLGLPNFVIQPSDSHFRSGHWNLLRICVRQHLFTLCCSQRRRESSDGVWC